MSRRPSLTRLLIALTLVGGLIAVVTVVAIRQMSVTKQVAGTSVGGSAYRF